MWLEHHNHPRIRAGAVMKISTERLIEIMMNPRRSYQMRQRAWQILCLRFACD
jgi:hypothetical protein